jgi:uncharacterized protein with von Willebrand factor type A (vWA) domain
MGGVSVPIAPLPGLVGFTHALRRAGLTCDAHRIAAFLAAVDQLDLTDPANLYWAGRITLCSQADDLPDYDEAFAAWFTPGWRQPPTHGNHNTARRRPTVSLTASVLPAQPGDASPTQARQSIATPAPSDVEVLRQRDIGKLTPAEQEHLAQLFALLKVPPPRRTGLRNRPTRRGDLDPRRTLRALLANGGEPVRLRHRRKADRPRRVVLLVDVSGSMRGERVRTAAATVGALAAELERDDLGVIAFWSDAAVLERLGQHIPAGRLLDALLRIPARGLTNISFPLQVARQQLARIPARDARVLLLSDCVHNAGPDPRLVATGLARLDVLLDASGEHDEELARDLARLGRGRLARVRGYRDVAPAVSGLFAR